VRPSTLDHVAFWVEDRDRVAAAAIDLLGMHVIERTDRFTLVGADARRFKLTLFSADGEGPREPGPFAYVALRVPSRGGADAEIDLGEGVRIRLIEDSGETGPALDHVALVSADPEATAADYLRYGFASAPARDGAARVEIGGAFVELRPGKPGDDGRPLLNHIALLVDSADAWRADAEDQGIEVAEVVDAPNTYAVFVWLPEGVKLEYVEHKPTFSLT
jgi:catechol 2,3-dioxygenase-like lactoylglutathione lyase family enzyme